MDREIMPVADRLIEARGDTPRADVAKAVGISLSALSMYETGQRIPRDEIKRRLASFYGRSIQDLFF